MGITVYLKRLVNGLHRLMVPITESCLTCGGEASLQRHHYGICEACYRQIPWLAMPRCLRCGRGIGCPDCSRAANNGVYFIANRSAVHYNEQMRQWLSQYKYRGQERYAPLFIMMLDKAYEKMGREFEQTDSLSFYTPSGHKQGRGSNMPWNVDIITSVPVSSQRLSERGFNQAEILGRGLAQLRGLPYIELLVRNRHSAKQSFKSRAERLKDMENMFSPSPNALQALRRGSSFMKSRNTSGDLRSHEPIRILIVDDIYTTGSTVNACSHVLQLLGTTIGIQLHIYCLTWARS